MRVLPKRLIPLLTLWEVVRLVRGRQNRGNRTDTPATAVPPRTARR